MVSHLDQLEVQFLEHLIWICPRDLSWLHSFIEVRSSSTNFSSVSNHINRYLQIQKHVVNSVRDLNKKQNAWKLGTAKKSGLDVEGVMSMKNVHQTMNATRKNGIPSGSTRSAVPRAPDLDLSPGSVMATLIYRGEVFQH